MGALVKIDGKEVEKLISVVSSGIGTLYHPRKIRKEADAQAYAIRVLSKAQAEANAEARLIEIETEDRICRRIAAKEIRRQENIDSVVEMAAGNLDGEEVSEKPVDIDWATRFFEIVQDVSREEMIIIWAKILAKEIKEPSTFSIRTLEVLRNITAEEALTFEKVSQFFLSQNGIFIYNNHDVLNKYGVHYVDLALLTECGLLQTGDFVVKNFRPASDKETTSIILYGKYVMLLKMPAGSKVVDIPVVLLTKVGQELYGLLEPKTSLEYMKDFAQGIKMKNQSVVVQYSEWVSKDEKRVEYKTPAIVL